MKVKFYEQDWECGIKFYFYRDAGHERHLCVGITGKELTFRTVKEGEAVDTCTMEINDSMARTFIQSFLDEAWEHGYRPSKEKRTREQVEKEMMRLQNHLEDMRTLVFEYEVCVPEPRESYYISKKKEEVS